LVDTLAEHNLILAGTGDVNGITGYVFATYQRRGVLLRPGCHPAFSPNIVGQEKKYMPYPGQGLLVLCANPWNPKRLCIIAGGVHAAGTTGAMFLLREYLESRVALGNNRLNEKIPSKVFSCARRSYSSRLRDEEALVPSEDIRNVVSDLGKWDICE
jgi:hypothetical protein